MSEKLVLDNFALVSLFHREAGWQSVQTALYEQEKATSKAILNWINWGEFYYIVKRLKKLLDGENEEESLYYAAKILREARFEEVGLSFPSFSSLSLGKAPLETRTKKGGAPPSLL